jgi:hypothetical protein
VNRGAACSYMSAPCFTMALKIHTAEPPARTLDDLEVHAPTGTLGTYPHLPPDAIAFVLEQIALINAHLDAQATEIVAQRQRDAQCDSPRPIQTTTSVKLPLHHHTHSSVTTIPPPHHTSLLATLTTNTHLVANRPCRWATSPARQYPGARWPTPLLRWSTTYASSSWRQSWARTASPYH